MLLENFSEGNRDKPIYIICAFSNSQNKIFSDIDGREFRKILTRNGFNKETTLLVNCFNQHIIYQLLRLKISKCVLFAGMQVCQFLDMYYCHLNSMRGNIYEYIYLKEYYNIDLFTDEYNVQTYNMITHDYRHVFSNSNKELKNVLIEQLNRDLRMFFEVGQQLLKGNLINGI